MLWAQMSSAMKAWMEMIHTCRRTSCAAMVTAPKLVTDEVADTMTIMDDTFLKDRENPLCRPGSSSQLQCLYCQGMLLNAYSC